MLHLLERQHVRNVHAVHYFQCAGLLLDKFPFGSFHLDNILIEGDKIHKFLNKDDFLSVDELPRRIKIYDRNIGMNIELHNLYEGLASQEKFSFQDIASVSYVCSQGYLIFICNYTILEYRN